MGDALEDDLDKSEKPDGSEDRKSSAEIIHALDDILTTRNPRHKSDIEWTTLNGILRGMTINRQLEEKFKSPQYRIGILDELINNRMDYVSSIRGKGKADAIKMMEAVKAVIEAHGGIDVTDRLLGMRKV